MDDHDKELSFEQNLEVLQAQINYLSDRIKNGRIKDVKKEELKIKWIRTLGYLCKTYVEVQSANKIESLEDEFKILRENLESNKNKKIK